MLTVSLLKHCRPRTQINAFIISSSHATRSSSLQLRWYNYSFKASSPSPSCIRSMVPLKLITKRCVLSSSTTTSTITSTQGIIDPFNTDVSFSISSSSSPSSLSSSLGVISGVDDDDDIDNVDYEAEMTSLRWKAMCSKTYWTSSDYGMVSRYRSSSYPSSHVKRNYSTRQMTMMMRRRRSRRRTFSTTGRKHGIWTPDLIDKLIVLAEKYNQNGYIDWVNVASEMGNGLTNVQCKSKHDKLIKQGMISFDDINYMAAAYTPDPTYRYDDDVVKAFKNQIKKSPKERIVWSLEMDDRLEESVKENGQNWVIAAARVGEGQNNISCRNRWNYKFKPKIDGCSEEEWTLEELKDLVLIHSDTVNLTGSVALRPSIDWTTISKTMRRPYKSCQFVWRSICNQRRKKGDFTKEEDEFIIQKVVEAYTNTSTGKKCRGLWVSIGNELNRDPDLVLKRWNRNLSKQKSVLLLLEDIEKMKSV